MDAAEYLKLLSERQAQPMNTLEDRPDFLNEATQEDIEGQAHVFKNILADGNMSSIESSSVESGVVKNMNGDPTNTAGWNWRDNKRPGETREKEDSLKSATANAATLLEADTLTLINMFLSKQEERVQTYKDFNTTFESLLKNCRIEDYPRLCSEITTRFSEISNQIIALKKMLGIRGGSTSGKDTEVSRADSDIDIAGKTVSECIGKIQSQEQEKLLVVAAVHLDKIQKKYPNMTNTLNHVSEKAVNDTSSGSGRSIEYVSNQSEYTNRKIREIESKIGEYLEEITEVKCELVLG
jgi:hypothetical protein